MTDETRWVRTMIAPDEVVRDRTTTVERRGFAYLLAGRFIEYLHLAEEQNLPKFGSVHYESPSRSQSLLEALALYLGNDSSAIDRFRALGAAGKGDLRTAANVLASIALADNFDPASAVDVLETELRQTQSALSRAVVLLHLGVREAELGRPDNAITYTARAAKAAARLPRSDASGALSVVAQANLWRYSAMTGKLGTRSVLNRQSSPVLVSVDALRLDGLETYIDDHIEASLRDPSVVHISFRSVDTTDARLTGALLRCECLGDWDSLGAVRKILGRYRLLTSVGVAERQPDAAFYMLRRAGDAKGIEAGVRTYMRMGPLQPLQRLASVTADTPWLIPEWRAVLSILEETAEVMPQSSADRAIARLVERALNDLSLGRGMDFFNAMDAMRALVQVCTPALASMAASQLLNVAGTATDSVTLQSIGKVADVIDWTRIDAAVIDRWMAYVSEHLSEVSDQGYLAGRAAGGLSRVRSVGIKEVALQTFDKRSTLATATLLLEMGARLPLRTREAVCELAMSDLGRITDEAAKGQVSFGRTTDAAAVLTVMLTRYRNLKGWPDLVRFITDPRIAWTDRLGAYRLLCSKPLSIPSRERKILTKYVATEPDVSSHMFVDSAQVRGEMLSVAVQLSALNPSELLARTLSLATEPRPQSRIAAAQVLASALQKRPSQPLVTLALSLAQDAHYEVRAAAGAAIASIRLDGVTPLSELLRVRVLSLVTDPGTAAPRAILGALLAGHHKPRLDPQLSNAIETLKATSPSIAIRWRASRVLARLAEQ
jgi:hypothetical protein